MDQLHNAKIVEWILRIAVAGEFLGHGVFGLQKKQEWAGWVTQLSGANPELATQIIFWVGLLDVAIAAIVLLKPIRLVLLWAAFWGFWTALVRPLVDKPVWDFIERFANWGAPLALLFLYGWPKHWKEWLK